MEKLKVGDIEVTPTIKRLCDGFTWVINQINEKTDRKLTYGDCEEALQIAIDAKQVVKGKTYSDTILFSEDLYDWYNHKI